MSRWQSCEKRIRRRGFGLNTAMWIAWMLCNLGGRALAEAPVLPPTEATNSFPDPAEVFQGRTFASPFAREVFFLKRIREAYPSYWAPLLGANILVTEYVVAPAKLQKFVEELGEAVEGTDDIIAITNLQAIVSQPAFYANTNVFRPEILRAATVALLKIGPQGRRSLASAFDERHYRLSPESLEVLAESLGEPGVEDQPLASALAATAFNFTTESGGNFPNCTRKAAAALLRLPGGVEWVRQHLKESEVFDDPGRFQDVIEAVLSARAAALLPDLVRISSSVKSKLQLLKTSAADPASAAPYVDALAKLDSELGLAIEGLKKS